MSEDKKINIVVVDDEESMRDFLEILLSKEGYLVESFSSAVDALSYVSSNPVDVVITDLNMPVMDGLTFLKEVKAVNTFIPVIIITAYASIETAIDAMKYGAYDYFTKPFNVDDIKIHVKRALEWRELSDENTLLKEELKVKQGFQNLVGLNSKMKKLYETIVSVSPTKANVLITGESGTGKELVAKAVHYSSDRKDKPFIAVNCGAIPETLIESEFFGHKKGAFTGAVSDREGLLGAANGGTLFLDEVTEMPLNVQVKFLRFLEERNYRQVGGTKDIAVDIRLISASNKNIKDAIKEKVFREDLFYRLNVINLTMPSLKERKDDIPVLARHFLENFTVEFKKNITSFTEEAMATLVNYDYPGNVRELENAVERAVAIESSGKLTVNSLPEEINKFASVDNASSFDGNILSVSGSKFSFEVALADKEVDMESVVEDFERKMIMQALKKSGGVKKKAAEILGMSFRSFRYKLKKYE